MLACAFPAGKHLLKWYFGRKMVKKTATPFKKIIREMGRGIRAFDTLTPYHPEGDNT